MHSDLFFKVLESLGINLDVYNFSYNKLEWTREIGE